MAILCGRSCSFTVGGTSYTSHTVSVAQAGTETDVTHFGSGLFGDFVVCSVNGTVNASFYDNILSVLTVGDVVTLVLVLGYDTPITLTFTDAVVQSINSAVDAKGIAMFDSVFRLTGNIA